jgi:rod shape determining protein RodA
MKVFLRWATDMVVRFSSSLDWVLCLALGMLMLIGLAVLKSAGGDGLVFAQGARFAVGLGAMWAISRMSILRIRSATPLIYAISMIPLLAVFVLGTGKYGRQWLDLKLFYLQPAELLKVSLPMMVAWYLHKMPLPPRFSTVMVSAVIIGVPTGLVMLQPDFGTGVLIAASGAFVLLLAGLPWWWVGVAVGGVAAAAPVAWIWLLRPYQKDRIMMLSLIHI